MVELKVLVIYLFIFLKEDFSNLLNSLIKLSHGCIY